MSTGSNDKLIARGAAAQLRVRQKAFDPLNLLDNASVGSRVCGAVVPIHVNEGSGPSWESEHPYGFMLDGRSDFLF